MSEEIKKDLEEEQAPEEEIIEEEEILREEPEEEGEEEPVYEEPEAQDEKYLRLMADFQNYKRRVEKERSDVHAFANEKLVTNLLEVLDNFDRALDAEETEGFKDGMELIFQQFVTVLQKAGMEEIEALEQVFDPNLHSAVIMEETDKVKSGCVSEVLQKGYTLNGKVIRPSMVKVAK